MSCFSATANSTKIAFLLDDVLSELKSIERWKMNRDWIQSFTLMSGSRTYLIDFQYFQHEFLWRNWKSSPRTPHSWWYELTQRQMEVENMLWDGKWRKIWFFLQRFTMLLTSYGCETRKLPFLTQTYLHVLVSRRKLQSVKTRLYMTRKWERRWNFPTQRKCFVFVCSSSRTSISVCVQCLILKHPLAVEKLLGGEKKWKFF